MEDLLSMMRRQSTIDSRNAARDGSDKENRVTAGMLKRGEGSAYAGYIKGKVKFPPRCPAPQKPATGPAAPKRVDTAVKAMRDSGMTVTDDAMSTRQGGGRSMTTGVTSTRLYALRGPVQFRPYLLDRKGYKNALQVKVDAGMLVIVGKAKTKTVPAHWRVELHCGKDITVLHSGFNAHGYPASKDAAIGNAYQFLVK